MVSFLVLFTVIIWCCHCRRHCLKEYMHKKACSLRRERDERSEKKRSFFFMFGILSRTPHEADIIFLWLGGAFQCLQMHTDTHTHTVLGRSLAKRDSNENLAFFSFGSVLTWFLFPHHFFTNAFCSTQRRYIHLSWFNACRCILIFDIFFLSLFFNCFFFLFLRCAFFFYVTRSHFSYAACTLHDRRQEWMANEKQRRSERKRKRERVKKAHGENKKREVTNEEK